MAIVRRGDAALGYSHDQTVTKRNLRLKKMMDVMIYRSIVLRFLLIVGYKNALSKARMLSNMKSLGFVNTLNIVSNNN